MSNLERTPFYRDCCLKTEKTACGLEYTMQCIDGTGTMTCYEVFPGLDLYINHFRAYHCREYTKPPQMIQLDYCVSGRYEWLFNEKDCQILPPGDIAIHYDDGMNDMASIAEFPLGYFDGLGLIIDCGKATAWGVENLGVFHLDFHRIKERYLSSNWCCVRSAGPRCEQVLQVLYEAGERCDLQYIRLKILELFLLLERLPLAEKTDVYFPKSQVELVKRIRERLIREPSQYSTVEQLAEEYQISVTQLQKTFRSVYGAPIYQYLREYRLEQAATALQQTSRPITAIALDAGFANPGKFSASFKRRFGMTPTAYRASQKSNTEMEQPC